MPLAAAIELAVGNDTDCKERQALNMFGMVVAEARLGIDTDCREKQFWNMLPV
jgi:hypothetical protein